MTKRKLNDAELDQLFGAAKSPMAAPDDAFLAALVAQAETAIGAPRSSAPPAGWSLSSLRDLLGGWAGLGGLAMATCAGVWIGINPPMMLPDAALYLLAAEDSVALEALILDPAQIWDTEEEL